MKHMIETDQCGGHVPGAKSIPSRTSVASDRTFESAEELQTIYLEREGIDSNRSTIAYCRIPGMHQIIE
jgi:thiosulfate/3-mercaptopyruvate sulfurtransferase